MQDPEVFIASILRFVFDEPLVDLSIEYPTRMTTSLGGWAPDTDEARDWRLSLESLRVSSPMSSSRRVITPIQRPEEPFLIVNFVVANSPAALAGVEVGDLVTGLNSWTRHTFPGLEILSTITTEEDPSPLLLRIRSASKRKVVRVQPVKWKHGVAVGLVLSYL
jgi:hypothetical protein